MKYCQTCNCEVERSSKNFLGTLRSLKNLECLKMDLVLITHTFFKQNKIQ